MTSTWYYSIFRYFPNNNICRLFVSVQMLANQRKLKHSCAHLRGLLDTHHKHTPLQILVYELGRLSYVFLFFAPALSLYLLCFCSVCFSHIWCMPPPPPCFSSFELINLFFSPVTQHLLFHLLLLPTVRLLLLPTLCNFLKTSYSLLQQLHWAVSLTHCSVLIFFPKQDDKKKKVTGHLNF